MSTGDIVRLCVLAALLLLSAFFSSTETALTTVNRIRIRNLADAGDRRAKRVLKILEKPDRMLSAILIGNNIVNMYASALAAMIATDFWGNRSVGIATGILTLIVLVFGEIAPKTASTFAAEDISLHVAGVVQVLMVVLRPIIYIVNHLAKIVLSIMNVDTNRKGDTITEDELRTMVEVSHQEGEIEEDEKTMINNVFDFGDAVVRDVMVPRVDMTAIDVEIRYEDLMEVFREEKYTRFPVYEDTIDNVIGILNIKDIFLKGVETAKPEEFELRQYLRKPAYTFEQKNISDLMLEMRRKNINIVIVLDEYGITSGMITMEDILEEIVGEIHDEYDTDEDNNLRKVGRREYLIEGSMNLDDIDDRLKLNLQSEDYDSIGGLMIGILGHLPKQDDTVVVDGIRIVADRMKGNRIDRVRLFLPEHIASKIAEE